MLFLNQNYEPIHGDAKNNKKIDIKMEFLAQIAGFTY